MGIRDDDAIRWVDGFLKEKLASARPGDAESRIPPGLTAREASWFREAVRPRGQDPPLLEVSPQGRMRSDRFPHLKDGGERGYLLLSEQPAHDHETLIEWSAIARLQYEFNWPRDRLICESPRVEQEGQTLLKQDAVDVVLLEEPCPACAWRMSREAMRSEVVVEVKRNARLVDSLIREMRACQAAAEPGPTHSEHNKCLALAVLRARFFLAVAAAETWRLFTVCEREGRRVLGDELTPDLGALHFEAADMRVRPS